ncbi:MAG: cysteine desulfurase family protein [Planctomycetota bacterium]
MIYLDHHSTTPCHPDVLQAMTAWLAVPANPHSTHAAGIQARAAVDESLAEIASLLDGDSGRIVATSGATESVNLAITGFCLHPRQKRRVIATTPIEHPCVLETMQALGKVGFTIRWVDVDAAGQVQLDSLRRVCDDQTALVSVGWANNEIGTIQPMRQIADVVHARGAVLHTDATQAVGRIPVSIVESDVDLLSASAHKFYGPQGVGLLMLHPRRRVRLRPSQIGGGQQSGLRGGTMPVALCVGMARALRLAQKALDDGNLDDGKPEFGNPTQRLSENTVLFWQRLQAEIPGLHLNGLPLESEQRLPGNLNFSLPDVEGEALLAATPGLAMSTGSACSSVDPTPSHVLMAIGLDESAARRSLRIGLGRNNTAAEVEAAVAQIGESYRRLKAA